MWNSKAFVNLLKCCFVDKLQANKLLGLSQRFEIRTGLHVVKESYKIEMSCRLVGSLRVNWACWRSLNVFPEIIGRSLGEIFTLTQRAINIHKNNDQDRKTNLLQLCSKRERVEECVHWMVSDEIRKCEINKQRILSICWLTPSLSTLLYDLSHPTFSCTRTHISISTEKLLQRTISLMGKNTKTSSRNRRKRKGKQRDADS